MKMQYSRMDVRRRWYLQPPSHWSDIVKNILPPPKTHHHWLSNAPLFPSRLVSPNLTRKIHDPLLHHYTRTGNRAFSSVSLVELRRGSMICLLRTESQACYIKPQLHLTNLSHFMTTAGSSWGPCELRREQLYSILCRLQEVPILRLSAT